MIKRYVQGSFVERNDTDNEMYCHIGRFAIDVAVHEALGVAVTGKEGDIWLFSFNKDIPVGFTQLRMMQNGKAHIRYLYALTEKQSEALAKAAIAVARTMEASVIFTNDRESATLWSKFGFKLQHSHHGTFGKWERELK